MLFAKVRFRKVYLVFLFSVLSFNFSNCFNSQDIVSRFNNLDVTHKIEIGLAAGKLPTAILADLFAMQDKKKTALVLKTISLALDVSDFALKAYNHSGDVSSFQYGYGIYDLVGIWNDVTDLMSDQKTESLLIKNKDLENSDKEEINPAVANRLRQGDDGHEAMADRRKSHLKQLAFCLLKYSFLAADSATSIAFTLDEKDFYSYRNMYSWMNCWSKVLASSIKTKNVKISSKVPVYLAGALISALYSKTSTTNYENNRFNNTVYKPIKDEIDSWCKSLDEKIIKYKEIENYSAEIKKELDKKITKCEEIENDSAKSTAEKEVAQKYREEFENDSSKIIQDAERAKEDREYFETKKNLWSKWIRKLGKKMSGASKREDVIENILKNEELVGLFNLLVRDPSTGQLKKDFINNIDPELIHFFEQK